MIAHVWKRNHLKPDCINYCFWVFILQLYLNKLVLLLGVYFPIQLQFYLRNCFTLMFTFHNSNCVYRTGFTFRWFVRYRWLLQQLKSQFKRSRNPLERKFTKTERKKKIKRQRKIERHRGKHIGRKKSDRCREKHKTRVMLIGQVVSMLAFYSGDPSLNSAEVCNCYWKGRK